MNKLLHPITDWVATKRGMWITIIAQNKVEELFPNDMGTPGILVFHNEDDNDHSDELRSRSWQCRLCSY